MTFQADNKKNTPDFNQIKQWILESNKNAISFNNSKYPIQEQASLLEIWEYVDCECDETCNCKKFGCKKHWKLKNNLSFDDLLSPFLRMFVNRNYHKDLKEWIYGGPQVPDEFFKQVVGAYRVIKEFEFHFSTISEKASNHNKTLLCSEWDNDFWREKWSFSLERSIYKAKLYCILLPDVGIPYDDKSRNKIYDFFNLNKKSTYHEFLMKYSDFISRVIECEQKKLDDFRRLDDPSQVGQFNPDMISLKKNNFNYGISYSPPERPISRVADKLFYMPSPNAKKTI